MAAVFALTTTQFLGSFFVAMVMGFVWALFLGQPAHQIRKMILALKGARPRPVGIITEDGHLDIKIVPTRFRSTNPTKPGQARLREGYPLNIAGLGNGYLYYERCISPVEISPIELKEWSEEVGKELEKDLPKLPKFSGVGIRAISPDTISNYYQVYQELAVSLGTEQVNKKIVTLVFIVIALSFGALAIGIWELNVLNNLAKLASTAYAQLQQGNFGVVP